VIPCIHLHSLIHEQFLLLFQLQSPFVHTLFELTKVKRRVCSWWSTRHTEIEIYIWSVKVTIEFASTYDVYIHQNYMSAVTLNSYKSITKFLVHWNFISEWSR
jgi:hypothetical protein